jgi:hypothetical protein
MDCLKINCFMVCITIELGVEQEVKIGCGVVLVTFDVLDSDTTRGLADCVHDHVDCVPVCIEREIREALFEWSG